MTFTNLTYTIFFSFLLNFKKFAIISSSITFTIFFVMRFECKNRKIVQVHIYASLRQGFGREKDGNRVNLCFRSIVLSFESGRFLCYILVIKMAVRF